MPPAAAIASVSSGGRIALRGGMVSGIARDQCRAATDASNGVPINGGCR
jgi:hypothetical protein